MHLINTYTKLIDTFTKHKPLKSCKLLHSHLIVNGLASSLPLTSKLIKFYVKCKQLPTAQYMFDEIPQRNLQCWVSVIGSYACYGYSKEAVSLFDEMRSTGYRYDRFVMPSVLKACAQLSDCRTGEKLHAGCMKVEFGSDDFVACALVDMYAKCGRMEKAKRVFDEMAEKDLASLNALVCGYVHNSMVEKAAILVEETELLGLKPDIMTWNTLILGFSQANDLSKAREILNNMEADKLKPDVISWTSVISGMVQNFHNVEAIDTFRQMLKNGLNPTSATISALLPACTNIGDLRRGKEIHGYSVVMGLEKDLYARSALIDMYAKCGIISNSTSLFRKMSERNTVTWNSMIFGYANHGYCSEAIELFNQMLSWDEEKVDHLTFTAVLTACSHGGMVELGERVFKMMQEKYKIVPRLEHYACFVDLLGKAGKINEAYDFIQEMPIDPDLFVWGAFLGACKQHACLEPAEIAAEELARLEPESAGSSVLLSNLYAEFNRLENAFKVKKMMMRKKLKIISGSSWIELV